MTTTGSQYDVIAFLGDPATHGRAPVERVETHSAMVFLAGDKAYKLKRAVKFPFLDFSSVEKRRLNCEREITLNRRTAPDLYLDAHPITRDVEGQLAFGGGGETVDWVVVMNRFDQETLFDRLVIADALTPEMLLSLADRIAAFHELAEETSTRGGAAAMRWVVDDNIEELSQFPDLFGREEIARLARQSRDALDGVPELLDRRQTDGFVRRCHGDLHLQNICLIEGRPTLFDCIEFNDDIACIDVLYDLAFLLMDLEHRGRPDLANLVLNRYLDRSGDYAGIAALPLFLSCRAAIKAKIGAIAGDNAEQTRAFFDQALTCLENIQPVLVAVGGAPGTGKSTLARRIAPDLGRAPGALVLRTDVLRKQMLGRDILERLPESAYDQATTQRTYERILEETRDALAAGRAIVADATFTNTDFRTRIEALAHGAGVPFAGLWLEAPTGLRETRVETRTADASDATVELIRRERKATPAPRNWIRIDARDAIDTLAETALATVRNRLKS